MAEPQQSPGGRIPIGVGGCLLGQPVRYNGLGRRANIHLDALGRFFETREKRRLRG